MPEEIFSEQNWMANNGTLCKTLLYDITRQVRVPAANALVNASKCYDRIAHAMASLVFQAFGVPITAVESMLATIEYMKFFSSGDSTSYVGGGISIKTQGMCQGIGASLAVLAVISICILKAHGRKGHGAKFVCPKLTNWRNIYQLSSLWITQICCILTSQKTKQLTRCMQPFRRVLTAGEISSLPWVEHYSQASASTPLSPLIGSTARGSTH